MHIKVKDLPSTLQAALKSCGYARADIGVEAKDNYTMQCRTSGAGRRGFTMAVDLATGKSETVTGSWGGANMFNPGNSVDLDDTRRPLPPNFAVVHGSEGDGVRAYVEVNPQTLIPLLPATAELSKVETALLDVYCGLSTAGRKRQVEQWIGDAGHAAERTAKEHGKRSWNDPVVRKADADARCACNDLIQSTIEALVHRKFLAKNKAGSISVTTEGKNARTSGPGQSNFGGYGWWPGKTEEKMIDGKCEACQDNEHAVCKLVEECSCCGNARRKMLEE